LLLAAKDKLAVIDDIAEEYQALVDNYRGIEGTEIAEVTTAVPLDADYQLKNSAAHHGDRRQAGVTEAKSGPGDYRRNYYPGGR